MPDLSKYELLLSELSALETQLIVLKEKYNDTAERNKELNEEVNALKKENFSLKQRVSSLETDGIKFQNAAKDENLLGSFTDAEKEELRTKIQRMIARIDNHLSS